MQKEYNFYVYILTNYSKNVLYIGFTNNIARRIIEHKNGIGCDFTRKYKLRCLVYYEETENIHSAIEREKEIKKWRKEKKLELIRESNPALMDLSPKIFRDAGVGKLEIVGIVKELKDGYKRGYE